MHGHLCKVDGHSLYQQVLDFFFVRQRRLLHVGDVEAVWPRLCGRVTFGLELLIPLNSPLVSDFVLVLCHHLDAEDLAQVDFEEVEDRRPL